MKPSGPSLRTTSVVWSDHVLGPGPRPKSRPGTWIPRELLQVILLLVSAVLANGGRKCPARPVRHAVGWGRSYCVEKLRGGPRSTGNVESPKSCFAPVMAISVHDLSANPRRDQSPPEPCLAGHHWSEEDGRCKPCIDGVDYTSSHNRLSSCLPCRVCKEDKVMKRPCTTTKNTECQCKPGTFEDKNSPEICQPSSNYSDGEDVKIPCTPETNQKCVPENPRTSQHNPDLVKWLLVIGGLVLLIVVLVRQTEKCRLVLLCVKRAFPGCEQNCENKNTENKSLLDQQTSSKTNGPHNMEPDKTQSSPTERKLLVPANGTDPDDALKSIFEYCSNEVPFNSWDRFMRQMGLTDNQIQVVRAETLAPCDVLYQMLLKWRHQTGRSASINHLLDALEDVGERCAREKIEDYAVKSGKFIYQNTAAQAGVVITQETEPGGSL